MQRSGFGWAYAETGGVARLRVSLSLAFYAEARPKLIQRRAYGYRNFQNYLCCHPNLGHRANSA